MEFLFRSPYYLDENIYKYGLMNHVLKAYGDMYDNRISPPQLHPLHSQSASDN
jgi:hypothetical protein